MRIARGFFSSRQFALQLDAEQAVLELGARHADMVGKLEAALEVAAADAAIEVLGALIAFGVPLPVTRSSSSFWVMLSSASVKPATAMTMRQASSAVFSML